jgi:hypothetical protein
LSLGINVKKNKKLMRPPILENEDGKIFVKILLFITVEIKII